MNVSSGMGSFGVTTDPEELESTLVGLAYPASKAAVTMLTMQYAKALPHRTYASTPPTGTFVDRHGVVPW